MFTTLFVIIISHVNGQFLKGFLFVRAVLEA